jgi:hypothetical protein
MNKIDTLKEYINKLNPPSSDSTACWTCALACKCNKRLEEGVKGLKKLKTEKGVKVMSCIYYKRDCVSLSELSGFFNISYRTCLRKKKKIITLVQSIGYKLDRIR